MSQMTLTSNHERFRDTRHFRTLDGVRAVAILLVIASHQPERWWGGLNGHLGVTLFFSLSGFLITTLCLREERERGRVSLGAFSVRRAFRILPLYYLVLAVYAVLIAANLLGGAATWRHNLPYYLTYMNELVTEGHYHHTWSLGVEEKFYAVWPVIGFVVLARGRRWRLQATVGLTLSVVAVNQLGVTSYNVGLYVPILMGCCLALALDREDLFALVERLARPPVVAATVVAFVLLHFSLEQVSSLRLAYAGAATAVLGLSVVAGGPLATLLGWARWKLIAERSYAMYLIHVLIYLLVLRVFGWLGGEVTTLDELPLPLAILRFLVVAGTCVAVADISWRLFERPLVGAGRTLSRRLQERQCLRRPDLAPDTMDLRKSLIEPVKGGEPEQRAPYPWEHGQGPTASPRTTPALRPE